MPLRRKNKKKIDLWFAKAFIIAFVLTIVFGLLSESILDETSWVVATIVILVLMAIALFFDMIGTAVILADPVSFNAMASKRIKGAKNGLKIIKAQNMVTSICSDVIGDIIGILSGAMGVGLALSLMSPQNAWYNPYLSILVSALIAAISISIKAIVRMLAKKHCHKIVWNVGKLMTILISEQKSKKQKNQKSKNNMAPL